MRRKITLNDIFSEQNIAAAMKIITKKSITPGLDGMHPQELPEYWKLHRKTVLADIENGTYCPTPLNIFFLSKPGKKEKRQISICTVLDQMLQHCIRIELEKYFTPIFHANSYGFIKGRGTQAAIIQCLQFINNGNTYVIDADIRKCFDSIKHRIVLKNIDKAAQSNVTELIRSYLKNPAMIGKSFRHRRVGLPQGSCMSPVISNIVLNNLDWYLHNQHISFVRYADDLVIFCESKEIAEKTIVLLGDYLESELSLRLNNEKTTILCADDLMYLGYAFCRTDKGYTLSLNEVIKEKMISKLEHHIRQKNADTSELLNRLGSFNRGWLNYYNQVESASMNSFIEKTEILEMNRIYNIICTEKMYKNNISQNILTSTGFILLSEWYDELRERIGGL